MVFRGIYVEAFTQNSKNKTFAGFSFWAELQTRDWRPATLFKNGVFHSCCFF